MTQSTLDGNIVVQCDGICSSLAGKRIEVKHLETVAEAGWYLGVKSGDLCPNCVKKAGGITHLILSTPKHEDNPTRPHDLMFTTEMAERTERERRGP